MNDHITLVSEDPTANNLNSASSVGPHSNWRRGGVGWLTLAEKRASRVGSIFLEEVDRTVLLDLN